MNTINCQKTYQYNNPVSFRAIHPDVIENFGNLPTGTRIGIERTYNIYKNSELVDLIFRDNRLVLRINKDTEMFGDKLEKGDWFNGVNKDFGIFKIEGSKIYFNLQGACNSDKKITLDFGLPVTAQILLDLLKGITRENADEFIPQFGALIEVANNTKKILARGSE